MKPTAGIRALMSETAYGSGGFMLRIESYPQSGETKIATDLSRTALVALRDLINEKLGDDEALKVGLDPRIFSLPNLELPEFPELPEFSGLVEVGPQRPHESLVWAMFYQCAVSLKSSPFGYAGLHGSASDADQMLEIWKKRWPEEEES